MPSSLSSRSVQDLVEKAIVPDYALSSHVPTADGFPQLYRGGAFVGEHGGWDRYQFNSYKVVFVPFSGGRPSGRAEDVVTGFLNANGEARRPAGQGGSGQNRRPAVGNTVWRVTSADQHVTSAGQ